MFKEAMAASLKKIFDVDKVTFNLPSKEDEQEVIFVEVDSAINKIKDGRALSRVTGKLRMFASQDKLPFGYFSKKIDAADPAHVIKFYFYNFEENTGRFQNIVERTLGFVYFFDSQYDPALGTLNSIELSEVTE